MFGRWFRRSAIEIELRPWETRALKQAEAGDFSDYIQLSFAYLILDNDRSEVLMHQFRECLRDPALAGAFRAYCLRKASGELVG